MIDGQRGVRRDCHLDMHARRPRLGRWLGTAILLIACLMPGGPAAPEPDAGPNALDDGGMARVVAVIDGDTVTLDDGREVRLVGIQAPKLPLGRSGFAAWPLAGEAQRHLEGLVLGRDVALRYGGRRSDRHGRALAHLVRRDDGLWVQGRLLSDGMARVYTFADNRALAREMMARERAARAGRHGIWALPYYAILTPEQTPGFIDSFQIVRGVVRDAAEVRGRIYLNYGQDWRTDFTVTVAPRAVDAFTVAGLDLLALEGQEIQVRGWLDSYNGPQIVATHPEQIERCAAAC